jgi:hypothetical protein
MDRFFSFVAKCHVQWILVNSYGYPTQHHLSKIICFQERSVEYDTCTSQFTSDLHRRGARFRSLLLRLAFSQHIKTGCGAGKTSAVWLQLLACVAVGAVVDGNALVFLLRLLLLPPPPCFGRAGLVPCEPRGHGAAGAHRRHPEHGVASRATATGLH